MSAQTLLGGSCKFLSWHFDKHLVKTELYGDFKVTIKDPIELRLCELIKWVSNSKVMIYLKALDMKTT